VAIRCLPRNSQRNNKRCTPSGRTGTGRGGPGARTPSGPRAAVDGAVAGAVVVAGQGRMPRAVIRASRRGPPKPDRKAIPRHHFHPRSRSPAIMTKATLARGPRGLRMTPGPRYRPTPRSLLVHHPMIGRRSGPDLRGDRASVDPTGVARRIMLVSSWNGLLGNESIESAFALLWYPQCDRQFGMLSPGIFIVPIKRVPRHALPSSSNRIAIASWPRGVVITSASTRAFGERVEKMVVPTRLSEK
jgi:hypothetical protein